MKRILFPILISILSLNLFAHTKMYHVDLSANIISFDDEEQREPTVDELVSGKSDEEFKKIIYEIEKNILKLKIYLT